MDSKKSKLIEYSYLSKRQKKKLYNSIIAEAMWVMKKDIDHTKMNWNHGKDIDNLSRRFNIFTRRINGIIDHGIDLEYVTENFSNKAHRIISKLRVRFYHEIRETNKIYCYTK
tara:strand:+ start:99 stop:437 length:339 start_codon:yes stop_codon:yes gene_type:complete